MDELKASKMKEEASVKKRKKIPQVGEKPKRSSKTEDDEVDEKVEPSETENESQDDSQNDSVSKCPLFITSFCPPSEAVLSNGKSLVIVDYNPLGWKREEAIRIPVSTARVIVQYSGVFILFRYKTKVEFFLNAWENDEDHGKKKNGFCKAFKLCETYDFKDKAVAQGYFSVLLVSVGQACKEATVRKFVWSCFGNDYPTVKNLSPCVQVSFSLARSSVRRLYRDGHCARRLSYCAEVPTGLAIERLSLNVRHSCSSAIDERLLSFPRFKCLRTSSQSITPTGMGLIYFSALEFRSICVISELCFGAMVL
ncbi:microtubule associated protein (MAP65/ASE1) family protein [Actinidia rufa]|uniref:Microtubule associated protein (MAP65/ASE1) family protein n=1 Tax=Actinidia rufa TaxID=165716 RepID=A0A7J0GG70_9ERIC|nr:microtubule associated protein (MAP65/ASE1) family protein [Actinidia rufa]